MSGGTPLVRDSSRTGAYVLCDVKVEIMTHVLVESSYFPVREINVCDTNELISPSARSSVFNCIGTTTYTNYEKVKVTSCDTTISTVHLPCFALLLMVKLFIV